MHFSNLSFCLKNASDSTPYVTDMKSIKMGDLLNAMVIKYLPKDKELKVNENFNIEKRPEFNNPECFLSQKEIETFKNLYSLDYQLYNYVKDHETRTGRCLTPDDILF